MAMYVVRVNIDNENLLKLIDFSGISKGILKLKSPKSAPSREVQNFVLTWKGLKIETFLNGSPCVGMVFPCKKFITDHKRVVFKKNLVNFPIEGTVDNFMVRFSDPNGFMIKPSEITEGEEVLFIRFITKRYHEILKDKDADGVSSQQVDVQIYVNGKFKPYSREQALSRGVQVVTSSHFDGCKFYEREYVDFVENNFDNEGNELETSVVESTDWIPCSL